MHVYMISKQTHEVHTDTTTFHNFTSHMHSYENKDHGAAINKEHARFLSVDMAFNGTTENVWQRLQYVIFISLVLHGTPSLR